MSKKYRRYAGHHLVPKRSRKGKHIEWTCVIDACKYYDLGSAMAKAGNSCPTIKFVEFKPFTPKDDE